MRRQPRSFAINISASARVSELVTSWSKVRDVVADSRVASLRTAILWRAADDFRVLRFSLTIGRKWNLILILDSLNTCIYRIKLIF